MTVNCIILANGIGKRLNSKIPKQFITIDGKSILDITINTFINHSKIDKIVVVTHKDRHENINNKYQNNNLLVVEGCNTRHNSAICGLKILEDNGLKDNDVILFHDAARPLVSYDIISRLIESMENNDISIPLLDSEDSIINIDSNKIVNRDIIKRIQTPEAFRYSKYKSLLSSYKGIHDDINPEIIIANKINFISGNSINFKITTMKDLEIAEKMIRNKNVFPKKYENDFVNKKILILGGTSGIGKSCAELFEQKGGIVEVYGRNLKLEDGLPFDKKIKDNNYDIVIHSVGTFSINNKTILKNIKDSSLEEWNYCCNSMLTSAYHTIKFACENMKKGSILIFLGSSSYPKGRQNFGLYSPFKVGLKSLVETACEELEPLGIRIHCIHPSRTNTPMRDVLEEDNRNNNEKFIQPEDIAKIIIDYCGDKKLNGQHPLIRVGFK